MKDLNLRDEIAIKVLDCLIKHYFDNGYTNPRMIASNAYTIAEAMIEARELADKNARIEWAVEYQSVL